MLSRLIDKYDIFLSRVLSAFCLFLILACANVWFDSTNNTILVLGYRFFILSVPLFFLIFNYRLTLISFALSIIGIVLLVVSSELAGIILIALGLAISGYMLKYYSSFTNRGAAINKIALGVGGILSGITVVYSQDKSLLLIFCFILVMASFICFWNYYKREKLYAFSSPKTHFSAAGLYTKKGILWAIIGILIGVKLISLVSILPQILIQNNNQILPYWYGWLLVANNIILIFLQLPIMKWISTLSRSLALIPLICGMICIALSPWLIRGFWTAFLWTIVLSIVECTFSYLDKLSQDDGLLLIKESAVGIGCACTVYLIRSFAPEAASICIGIAAFVLLGICYSMHAHIAVKKHRVS